MTPKLMDDISKDDKPLQVYFTPDKMHYYVLVGWTETSEGLTAVISPSLTHVVK